MVIEILKFSTLTLQFCLCFTEAKSLPPFRKRFSKVQLSIKKHLSHFIAQVQTDNFREMGLQCLGVILCAEKKKGFKDQTNVP